MATKPLLLAGGLAASLACTSAFAFGTGGYLMGSVGDTSVRDRGPLDVRDDTGWKATAGIGLGNMFALEAGYTRLGTFDQRGLPGNVRVDGIQLAGLVGAPVGPVTLFGKVGAYRWDSRLRGQDFDLREADGTDWMWGVGAQFTVPGPVGVILRVEWERFEEVLGSRADMTSVGVGIHF